MSAYVVVDITVTDPAGYEEYKRLAPPAVAAYGGRYIARGGATEVLEGAWSPKRLVILEFPSAARAREWFHSPEYRAAKQLRHDQHAGDRGPLCPGGAAFPLWLDSDEERG